MSNCFAGLDWASQDSRGVRHRRARQRRRALRDHATTRRAGRAAAPPAPPGRRRRSPSSGPRACWSIPWWRPASTVVPIHPNVVKATPAALPQPRRQERRLRRLPAGRPAAHRRPSLRPLAPAVRRDQGAARAGARARRSGGHPRAAGQPAAQPAGVVLARRRRDLRRHRLADRAGLRRALPDARVRRALGAKRMAAFCAQHAYSGRRSAEDLLARLHRPRCGLRRAGDGGQGRARLAPGSHADAPRRADPAALQPHRAPRRLARGRPASS